jgi:uncharacterized membrane protein YoaK (UPF0700 family)
MNSMMSLTLLVIFTQPAPGGERARQMIVVSAIIFAAGAQTTPARSARHRPGASTAVTLYSTSSTSPSRPEHR